MILNVIAVFDKSRTKCLFCKRRKDPYKGLYNFVGGHAEDGEDGFTAAYRELYEETGALKYTLTPICVYSVRSDKETFGMLYYAEISELEHELHSEIERIVISDELPESWTYPLIQPKLIEEAIKRNFIN